jgi:hypothetical protein
MTRPLRKSLQASALIRSVHKMFLKVPDPREFTKKFTPIVDHLMSGLAIFGLKFPSLLQYDRKRNDIKISENLKDLYHIDNPPSDTHLRDRLDEVKPEHLRPAFKKLFANFQRTNELEKFKFIDGYYLMSVDGTGQFSSSKVSCKNCCKKQRKNGEVTYYHQMLGACIIHPDKSNVIPLCPEIIQHQDGNTKNDCERNAAKRFIKNFRREHPHLKVIIVEDGLASNGPHITELENNKFKYILGAKTGDHNFLFDKIENSEDAEYYENRDERGFLHQFRFINNVSLNKSHPNLKVNFLEYRETSPKGKELNFSWVTNIKITKKNINKLMQGGRGRWRIENETFNTLKNLGYNFEHNYGHGKQYLSTIFCMLMILAFLIDQIQQTSCHLFQAIKKDAGSFQALWESMRVLFRYFKLESWEKFYQLILEAATGPPSKKTS